VRQAGIERFGVNLIPAATSPTLLEAQIERLIAGQAAETLYLSFAITGLQRSQIDRQYGLIHPVFRRNDW
jgi:hypothetical protein